MFERLKYKLSKKELIYLLTMLSYMFSSGLTLEQGMNILLADNTSKFNKHVPTLILQELENGFSLWEIFRDNEDCIGTGLWQQLEAAEKSGKIAQCMDRLAGQLKNDAGIIAKIRSAIMYPVMLIIAMLGAGYFMFSNIVPQIAETYGELDAELPMITQVAMKIADILITYNAIIFAGLVCLIALLVYLVKRPLRLHWHRFLTKAPVIGKIVVTLNYSLIYTILCDMIETGGSTVEAITIAGNSTKNTFIRWELMEAVDRCISNGYDLADTLADVQSMPQVDRLMLKVGQQTGHIIDILGDIAVRSKQECKEATDTLLELVNPIVMLFAALLVGSLLISVYLPLLTMSTAIA